MPLGPAPHSAREQHLHMGAHSCLPLCSGLPCAQHTARAQSVALSAQKKSARTAAECRVNMLLRECEWKKERERERRGGRRRNDEPIANHNWTRGLERNDDDDAGMWIECFCLFLDGSAASYDARNGRASPSAEQSREAVCFARHADLRDLAACPRRLEQAWPPLSERDDADDTCRAQLGHGHIPFLPWLPCAR